MIILYEHYIKKINTNLTNLFELLINNKKNRIDINNEKLLENNKKNEY